MTIGGIAMSKKLTILTVTSLIAFGLVSYCYAQEKSPGRSEKPASNAVAANDSEDKEARFQAFAKTLSNVQLVGMFTVDGKKMNDLNEERYEIKKAEKLPGDDDLWGLEARIHYGKHDVTVPMVITVKWADKTPVIVMDQLFIPGLGTFSARVVFHDGKYAGTWTHGEKGGHLFGRLEPLSK
jgi:hypothetical protein